MQPNQQPNQQPNNPQVQNNYAPPQPNGPQYSIDYLNQIAPKQSNSGMSNKLFFIIIGIVVFLAMIVGAMVFSSGSDNTDKVLTLAIKTGQLQTITTGANERITSNKLQVTNSSLDLHLNNIGRELAEPLLAEGVNLEELIESSIEGGDNAELLETLDEARLNAVYDRVYAREMSYELAVMFALVSEIEIETTDPDILKTLADLRKNLTPIREELAGFNESPS